MEKEVEAFQSVGFFCLNTFIMEYDKIKMHKFFSVRCMKNIIEQITNCPVDVGIKNYRGLYVVLLIDSEKIKTKILYIGISTNIYKRISYCKDHPYNILYDEYFDIELKDIVLLSVECGGQRQKLEKKLVNFFQPELNTHFKCKKYE